MEDLTKQLTKIKVVISDELVTIKELDEEMGSMKKNFEKNGYGELADLISSANDELKKAAFKLIKIVDILDMKLG